jgi:hypothetical protein
MGNMSAAVLKTACLLVLVLAVQPRRWAQLQVFWVCSCSSSPQRTLSSWLDQFLGSLLRVPQQVLALVATRQSPQLTHELMRLASSG